MSLPRYWKYKGSGVSWLGDIPTVWNVKRIKHTTYLKGRVGWKGLTSDEYLDSGYAYLVTGTDFSKKFINWHECHCVEQARYEDDPFIQLRDGDLLITKDGTIGKLALVSGLDGPACLNSGIFLIRPTSNYVTEYMYWVLKSEAFKVFCDLSSLGSTIQHLYQNVFEDFAFPVPSLQEQRSIATFLDSETAKIDALIAEQEKLISLLAEKRQATISHVVTKGLNPKVPMKNSGVAWLGDIPAHWKLPPLYMRYSSELGKMLDASRITGRHLVPYLRNVDVQWDAINYSELPVMDIEIDEYERYTVRNGDLLVCEGGEVGRAAVVQKAEEIIGFQKALHRLRARSADEYPRYMFYTFAWASKAGAFSGEGQSTIAHLTGEQLRKYRFPQPPLAEQCAIVDFLDVETTKITALTAAAKRAILLFKERRSTLITAAVTGQIDVRGTVSQSPADTPEIHTA